MLCISWFIFVALEKTPGASWLNLAANGCMPANGLANAEKFIISTLVYSAKQNKFLLLSKVSFCAHFVWFKINFIKRQLKSEPCVLSGWKKNINVCWIFTEEKLYWFGYVQFVFPHKGEVKENPQCSAWVVRMQPTRIFNECCI